jgi:hypothetical protein
MTQNILSGMFSCLLCGVRLRLQVMMVGMLYNATGVGCLGFPFLQVAAAAIMH